MKKKNNFIDDLLFYKLREELINGTKHKIEKEFKNYSNTDYESEIFGIKFMSDIINKK